MPIFKTPWCPEILKEVDWGTISFPPHRMIKQTSTFNIYTSHYQHLHFTVKCFPKRDHLRIRDIECHAVILHPNVIKIYGGYEDSTHVYILMEDTKTDLAEYMKRKTDFSASLQKKLSLPEKYVVKNILHPILSGIYHIHSMNVFHRNIIPENVVMGADGNWKLWGFDCATNSNQSWDGDKCDIWSLGVIAKELLPLNTPEAMSFVADTMRIEKLARPSAQQLFRHKLIIKYIDTSNMRLYNTLLYKNTLHNNLLITPKSEVIDEKMVTPQLDHMQRTRRVSGVRSSLYDSKAAGGAACVSVESIQYAMSRPRCRRTHSTESFVSEKKGLLYHMFSICRK